MAHEVVWTAGAEADLQRLYEQVGDHDQAIKHLHDPLDHLVRLLADFPGIGARVRGTRRGRRVLTGSKMRYGLFSIEEGRRILIHVLTDMRQNPQDLEKRLAGL